MTSALIPSFFGPYFPTLELNTEISPVNLHIQSKCGKMRTRKAPNMGTFYKVFFPCYVNIWEMIWQKIYIYLLVYVYINCSLKIWVSVFLKYVAFWGIVFSSVPITPPVAVCKASFRLRLEQKRIHPSLQQKKNFVLWGVFPATL